jgi:hypothetical protein
MNLYEIDVFWNFLIPPFSVDSRGYYRDLNGYLVHRTIAYHCMWKKYRGLYPLPFKMYIVHHKNRNKKDNKLQNLAILTPTEHAFVHKICDGCEYQMDCIDNLCHNFQCEKGLEPNSNEWVIEQ